MSVVSDSERPALCSSPLSSSSPHRRLGEEDVASKTSVDDVAEDDAMAKLLQDADIPESASDIRALLKHEIKELTKGTKDSQQSLRSEEPLGSEESHIEPLDSVLSSASVTAEAQRVSTMMALLSKQLTNTSPVRHHHHASPERKAHHSHSSLMSDAETLLGTELQVGGTTVAHMETEDDDDVRMDASHSAKDNAVAGSDVRLSKTQEDTEGAFSVADDEKSVDEEEEVVKELARVTFELTQQQERDDVEETEFARRHEILDAETVASMTNSGDLQARFEAFCRERDASRALQEGERNAKACVESVAEQQELNHHAGHISIHPHAQEETNKHASSSDFSFSGSDDEDDAKPLDTSAPPVSAAEESAPTASPQRQFNSTYADDTFEATTLHSPPKEQHPEESAAVDCNAKPQAAADKVSGAMLDELLEREIVARNSITDDERRFGFSGNGLLNHAYDAFTDCVELLCEEQDSRLSTESQEATTKNVLLDEFSSGRCIIETEAQRRSVLLRTVHEEARARQLIVEECDLPAPDLIQELVMLRARQLDEEECISRTTVGDDAHQSHSNIAALASLNIARCGITLDERRRRERVGRCAEEQTEILVSCAHAMLNSALQEETARCQLARDEDDARHLVEKMRRARALLESITELCTEEQLQRKKLAAQEWDERRPMYSEHRMAVVIDVGRPRKPPVPKAPKRRFIPQPPPKPLRTNSAPAAHRLSPFRSTAGRHLVPGALPLKKLTRPLAADSAVAKRLQTLQASLETSVTDESVGRKALLAREDRQWRSIVSRLRHALHAIDHAEACSGERQLQHKFRTSAGEFKSSHQQEHGEYERYRLLREEAKQKRLHYEERSRLQSLVSQLIAVDVEFDMQLALRAERLRCTAVSAPRPPFQFTSTTPWEVVPRLESCKAPHPPLKKLSRPATAQHHVAAPKRGPRQLAIRAEPQAIQEAAAVPPNPLRTPSSLASSSSDSDRFSVASSASRISSKHSSRAPSPQQSPETSVSGAINVNVSNEANVKPHESSYADDSFCSTQRSPLRDTGAAEAEGEEERLQQQEAGEADAALSPAHQSSSHDDDGSGSEDSWHPIAEGAEV